METRSIRPSDVSPEDDADWNEFITLEIGPHPDLSESQKRIIALDYGMRGGRTSSSSKSASVLCAETIRARYADGGTTTARPTNRVAE
jgi:hypothetical protein